MILNGKKAAVFFKGRKGDTGAKLVKMELTGQDENGGNVYLMTFDDGTTASFTAPCGQTARTPLVLEAAFNKLRDYTYAQIVKFKNDGAAFFYIDTTMFSRVPVVGDFFGAIGVTSDGYKLSVFAGVTSVEGYKAFSTIYHIINLGNAEGLEERVTALEEEDKVNKVNIGSNQARFGDIEKVLGLDDLQGDDIYTDNNLIKVENKIPSVCKNILTPHFTLESLQNAIGTDEGANAVTTIGSFGETAKKGEEFTAIARLEDGNCIVFHGYISKIEEEALTLDYEIWEFVLLSNAEGLEERVTTLEENGEELGGRVTTLEENSVKKRYKHTFAGHWRYVFDDFYDAPHIEFVSDDPTPYVISTDNGYVVDFDKMRSDGTISQLRGINVVLEKGDDFGEQFTTIEVTNPNGNADGQINFFAAIPSASEITFNLEFLVDLERVEEI